MIVFRCVLFSIFLPLTLALVLTANALASTADTIPDSATMPKAKKNSATALSNEFLNAITNNALLNIPAAQAALDKMSASSSNKMEKTAGVPEMGSTASMQLHGLVGNAVPPLVQVLNLYMLSKDPTERRQLVALALQALPLVPSSSISEPFRSDPPLPFKALMLRELNLTRALLARDAAQTAELMKTQSLWMSRLVTGLFSVPSESVPLTKLLLHADTFMREQGAKLMGKHANSEQDDEQTGSTVGKSDLPANDADGGGANPGVASEAALRMDTLKKLLLGAALPPGSKPAVAVMDLIQHSQRFNQLLEGVGRAIVEGGREGREGREDGAPLTGRELRLLDIIQCLDETASAVHKALTSMLASHCASDKTLLKSYMAVLLRSHDNSARNALHYLAYSGGATMMRDLIELLGSNAVFGKYDRVLLDALVTDKDVRGHTPVTYALTRFGLHSPIGKALADLISLLQGRMGSVKQVSSKTNTDTEQHISDSSLHFNLTDAAAQLHQEAQRRVMQPTEQHQGKDAATGKHIASDMTQTCTEESDGGWNTKDVLGGTARIPAAHDQLMPHRDTHVHLVELFGLQDLPTSASFYEQFVRTGTPVIFRGVGHRTDTAANQTRAAMAKDLFLQTYGSIAVPVAGIPYAGSFGVRGSVATLGEVAGTGVDQAFLREISLRLLSNEVAQTDPGGDSIEVGNSGNAAENSDAGANAGANAGADAGSVGLDSLESTPPGTAVHSSTSDPPTAPLYSFCTPSAAWAALLQKDVPLPRSIVGAQAHEGVQGGGQDWSYETQFYLGPAGSGAPPHFHGHAMNTLSYGSKRWWLFPPSKAFYSTQPAVEFAAAMLRDTMRGKSKEPQQKQDTNTQDTATSSEVNTEESIETNLYSGAIEVVQQAGDVLYVPALWGHATLNTQQSIGVAHEFSVEQFCME